jgi:hypothetical protein
MPMSVSRALACLFAGLHIANGDSDRQFGLVVRRGAHRALMV